MERGYIVSDVTERVRSISRQFGHGMIGYGGGRGTAHRLPWPSIDSGGEGGRMVGRRPDVGYNGDSTTIDRTGTNNDVGDRTWKVDILEGMRLRLLRSPKRKSDGNNIRNGGNGGIADVSRCEQLLNRGQMIGAGLCAAWVLDEAMTDSTLDLPSILDRLDRMLDDKINEGGGDDCDDDSSNDYEGDGISSLLLMSSCEHHCALRPRRLEVAMIITRLRGIFISSVTMGDTIMVGCHNGLDDRVIKEGNNNDACEDVKQISCVVTSDEVNMTELAKVWANRRRKKQ